MSEESETQEKEKEKVLVLVGHFKHIARCECKTTTVVYSYYEDLPPILCPYCHKENVNETRLDQESMIPEVAKKCEKCGCKFNIAGSWPVWQKITCPACAEPLDEDTDGDKTPSEPEEGSKETKG